MTLTRHISFALVVATLGLTTGCQQALVGPSPAVDSGAMPPDAGGAPDRAAGGGDAVETAPPASTDASDSAKPTDTAVADTPVGPPGACEYPAGAPNYLDSRFTVGSIMPNLTFTRENGSPFSLKDVHCDKSNRVLYWTVGGDNCPPCIAEAMNLMVPAWNAMGKDGLFVLEGFNGRNFLVSRPPVNPFAEWRRKTMWPPDGQGIAVVREPLSGEPDSYVIPRIDTRMPWLAVIEVATMKVLYSGVDLPTVSRLRSYLDALPPRQ